LSCIELFCLILADHLSGFTSKSLRLLVFLHYSSLITWQFQWFCSAGSSDRVERPKGALVLLVLRMDCAWLHRVFASCLRCCLPGFLNAAALFFNLFSFGFLFFFKIFLCLFSCPFSSAGTPVPNSDVCSVSLALTGCLSPFSLGHLCPFCSCSCGCCFSLQLALESCSFSSTPLLHPSFHRAASIIFVLLYGDFVLKVKVVILVA